METYVKLETATLAREKGLDTELDLGSNCICYNKDGHRVCYHVHFNYPDRDEYIYAPTQSFLANWLREKYQIQVYAVSGTTNGKKYRDYVGHVCPAPIKNKLSVLNTSVNDPRDEEFQTYEEAMEVALQIALEMI